MRTFIAVDLPANIKNEISKTQNKLKSALPEVSWIKPANLHLTLKFLGDVSFEQLSDINQIIDEVASKTGDFKIRLQALGAFPNIVRARIIWVGIDKIPEELIQTVQELETKLRPLGFHEEEREFRAHITIGRLKLQINSSILEKEIKESRSELFSKKLEFSAGRIILFQSLLSGPGGPVYTVLKEANFRIN